MTPDRVWLADLSSDHLRIVRNALEPHGWRLEESPAGGGTTDTPEGAIEIQIREKPSGGPGSSDASLPTLWLLPHGAAVPRASGEGPQDFVRLPVHREEIAARIRSLARTAGLEMELRRHQRELARQIDRRSGQMDALASELTSRLSAVVEYLDLLLDGTAQQIPGPQRRLLVEAKGAAERVAERIEEMVDASRAEVGSAIPVRLERLEIKPILEGLLEWSIPRLRCRQQELAVHLEPDTPTICGDGERLTQVLRHLIDNAHRFAPAGTRIEIGAVRDPDSTGFARITIADDGPGLDTETLSRLIGSSPERDGGGFRSHAAGAGLSIARAITVALGGELHASSRAGGGTRIGVRLPLWDSRAARIAEVQAVLMSPSTVAGSAWICRATTLPATASLASAQSRFALSPGEMLAICEEPPPGIPRLGRVRDFREAGSLARALLPRLRVAVGTSPVPIQGHGEEAESGTTLRAA
jgi:signal transduction histidine kinase